MQDAGKYDMIWYRYIHILFDVCDVCLIRLSGKVYDVVASTYKWIYLLNVNSTLILPN